MKVESFLKIIIDISEKFEKCNEDKTSTLHYETLHMSLAVCLREITEEQYNSIPMLYRKTYEKLEKAILEHVSSDYEVEYVATILEQGKFKPEIRKEPSRIVTKCKHKIGFVSDYEEETSL